MKWHLVLPGCGESVDWDENDAAPVSPFMKGVLVGLIIESINISQLVSLRNQSWVQQADMVFICIAVSYVFVF